MARAIEAAYSAIAPCASSPTQRTQRWPEAIRMVPLSPNCTGHCCCGDEDHGQMRRSLSEWRWLFLGDSTTRNLARSVLHQLEPSSQNWNDHFRSTYRQKPVRLHPLRGGGGQSDGGSDTSWRLTEHNVTWKFSWAPKWPSLINILRREVLEYPFDSDVVVINAMLHDVAFPPVVPFTLEGFVAKTIPTLVQVMQELAVKLQAKPQDQWPIFLWKETQFSWYYKQHTPPWFQHDDMVRLNRAIHAALSPFDFVYILPHHLMSHLRCCAADGVHVGGECNRATVHSILQVVRTITEARRTGRPLHFARGDGWRFGLSWVFFEELPKDHFIAKPACPADWAAVPPTFHNRGRNSHAAGHGVPSNLTHTHTHTHRHVSP